MIERNDFDAIIVGGSYAGLSAAMALGRSLRNVLIIDSGSPCNRQTPHAHNFITHDGTPPAAIASLARQQVLQYKTVQILDDLAVSGRKAGAGFEIGAKSGSVFAAKKLIFATGIKDVMPDIKGFSACWGITVIHCPYCHGYEFRARKTGIMANGERAFHLSSLVHNLTSDITILTSGKADFTADQKARFNAHDIPVDERKIVEIEHAGGRIRNVVFEDGTKRSLDTLYAALPFVQHSDIPAAMGCELTEQGYIKVDGFYKTSVEGIFACGDNVSPMRAIANAVYGGNLAGAMVNKELADAQF